MRIRWLMSVLLLFPAAASAAPQPLGALWRHGGDAVLVTRCPKAAAFDESCRGIALRHAGTVTPLGDGFARIDLLWSRRPGVRGPDVLVRGDSGGSGGDGAMFAITVLPRLAVRKWGGERYDGIAPRVAHGALRVDLPFNIEYFNGASHAAGTTVPIPMRWDGRDFAVDVAALRRPPLSPAERRGRGLAVAHELAGWVEDTAPSRRLYPPHARDGTPVTLQALTERMLSGHADAARALLRDAWPRSRDGGRLAMPGEAAFWQALCREVIRHPLWTSLRLDRLPHADEIARGAGAH